MVSGDGEEGGTDVGMNMISAMFPQPGKISHRVGKGEAVTEEMAQVGKSEETGTMIKCYT